MPYSIAQYIVENTFFFSVCKSLSKHKKITSLLIDTNDRIKSFHFFYKEVLNIYPECDRDILEKEYNLSISCALMAVKWKSFTDNRYLLQYRNEGCDITLPASDPFWDKYYPPNSWDDRSTVVEVRTGKYSISNSDDVQAMFDKTTEQIFRFNIGKQTFPIDKFIQQNKTT